MVESLRFSSENSLRSRGYTLFELMVVIAITSLLIAVAAAAYSTVQKKARDAKRRSDLNLIQRAEEQYKAQYSAYDSAIGGFTSGVECTGNVTDTLTDVPSDPKNDASLEYEYYCLFEADAQAYCMYAKLETGGGNCSSCSCDDVTDSCTYVPGWERYCVLNAQ